MKILVFSDTHDHVDNLRQVIKQTSGQVEVAIFCGDLCSSFMAKLFADIKAPIYACFGNNDEGQVSIVMKSPSANWTTNSSEFGEIDLDGRQIVFNHYPKLAELQAKSGKYDAVFYGHTHQVRNEIVNKTLLLNPGAVCGIQTSKYGVASYAIYDTKTNTAEIKELT